MLNFKVGVKIKGLQAEALLGLLLAEQIIESNPLSFENTPSPFVVTSCLDGVHGTNSLHYKGLAFDVRTRNFSSTLQQSLYAKLKEILNPLGFDVVLEVDHFHIEFDSK